MLILEIDSGSGYVDYSNYVIWQSIRIDDTINQPTLTSFALINKDKLFVIPPTSSYIRIRSTKFLLVLATGFITQTPNKTYLSLSGHRSPEPILGAYLAYEFNCTSDEWLLNVKTIPFIPAFINRTVGDIIHETAEALAPGFFDFTNVDDGDTIPYFEYDPKRQWSEIIKEFADSLNFRYKTIDKKIYFKPFGDSPLGVSYDELGRQDKFDPFALDTKPLDVPLVNDVIVIGDVEPKTIREDNFLGDAPLADFAMRHSVFGGESSLLLSENWDGDSFSGQWVVLDPDNRFELAGALNMVGGSVQPFGLAYIRGTNGVELGGHLEFEHGELEITGPGSGILGGIYGNPELTLSSCNVGFFVSGGVSGYIAPVLDGDIGLPFATMKAGKHYRFQTLISAGKWSRYDKLYRTLSGDEYGGTELASKATVTYIVNEIDLTTGVSEVIKHISEDTTLPAFALYAPVNSINLRAVLSFTQISEPIQGKLTIRGNVTAPSITGSLLPDVITLGDDEKQYTIGFGLQNQTATLAVVSNYHTLRFYSDTTPRSGSRVRLRTWESGRAVSRVRNELSISGSGLVEGDDGIRSAIKSDLSPLPRTSEDCDWAAKAFIIDRSVSQYNGTYNFTDAFLDWYERFTSTDDRLPRHLLFEDGSGALLLEGGGYLLLEHTPVGNYPITGRFFNVNAPTRGISSEDFLVNRVSIGVADLEQEVLQFSLGFGPDLELARVLPKIVKSDTRILTSEDTADPPIIQTMDDVGVMFLPDLVDAGVSGLITGTQVTIDAGVDYNLSGYSLEVRRTDSGWGKTDQNRLALTVAQVITLDRTQMDQTYYLRLVQFVESTEFADFTSRRTTAIRVVYPLVPEAPMGGVDAADQLHPVVNLQLSQDVRNICGIEIRDFDNTTVLLRRRFVSPTDLSWAYDNNEKRRSLDFYCYFFNLMWEYSPVCRITGYMAPPDAPATPVIENNGGIINVNIPEDTNPNLVKTEVESADNAGFTTNLVIGIAAGFAAYAALMHFLPLPNIFSIITKYFRARRYDKLGPGPYSVTASKTIINFPTARWLVGTLSPNTKPVGLTILDANKVFFHATDFDRNYRWDGTGWVGMDSDYSIHWFDESPTTNGWALCDGSGVTRSTPTGDTADYTTPNLIGGYLKATTSYSELAEAIAPTATGGEISGVTSTQPDHVHSLDNGILYTTSPDNRTVGNADKDPGHNHGGTATIPNHSHSFPDDLSTGVDGYHAHGAETGSESSHTHFIDHQHNAGHTHGTSPEGETGLAGGFTPAGTVNSSGAHLHNIQATDDSGSAHQHINMTAEDHVHEIAPNDTGASDLNTNATFNLAGILVASGDHRHSWGETDTELSGTLDVDPGTADGEHTHQIEFIDGADGEHDHTFTGTAQGSHRHTIESVILLLTLGDPAEPFFASEPGTAHLHSISSDGEHRHEIVGFTEDTSLVATIASDPGHRHTYELGGSTEPNGGHNHTFEAESVDITVSNTGRPPTIGLMPYARL